MDNDQQLSGFLHAWCILTFSHTSNELLTETIFLFSLVAEKLSTNEYGKCGSIPLIYSVLCTIRISTVMYVLNAHCTECCFAFGRTRHDILHWWHTFCSQFLFGFDIVYFCAMLYYAMLKTNVWHIFFPIFLLLLFIFEP